MQSLIYPLSAIILLYSLVVWAVYSWVCDNNTKVSHLFLTYLVTVIVLGVLAALVTAFILFFYI